MANELATGQVVVEKLLLITATNEEISLFNTFTQVTLVEDIQRTMMYGTVSVQEYNNYVETLPIVGEEFVQIQYKVNNDPDAPVRSHEFRVSKVANLSRPKDKTFSYDLVLISPEYYNGVQRSIDARKTELVEKMVEDFVKEDLGSKKELNFEQTKRRQSILFPSTSAIDSIKYCAFRAQSIDAHDSYFKFFETSEGFNFVSIGKLAEGEPKFEIRYDQVNTPQEIGEVNRAPFTAMSFSVVNKSDTASTTYNGGYSNSILCFDPLTKQYVYKEKNYFKDDSFLAKVESQPSNTPLFEDVVANDGALEYAFVTNLREKVRDNSDNAADMYVPGYEDFYLNRQMSRVHMDDLVVNASIPLTTRLSVGDVVTFTIPRDNNTTSDDTEDRYLSGRFLITKLTQGFTGDRGITDLELRRAGMTRKIEKAS